MESTTTATWRVMVSSTMLDLPEERQTARRVIQGEGMTPLNAEDPHSDYMSSPYDMSLDYARSCDLYVLIVGKRYGSRPDGMPEGDTRSVTHLEFDTARQANPRKIRIVVPLDAYTIAEDDRQRAFLDALGHFKHGYDFFTYDRNQPRALAAKLQQILQEWRESGTAGRDAYMGQVNQEYATFKNPVTGAQMRYEATVALRLRTLPAGRAVNWDAQMDAAERRRLRRAKAGDRAEDARDVGRNGRQRVQQRDDRQPGDEQQREQLRQAAQPIIAQVAEFLNRFGRLVVLGDPGAGKSTLLKRLAHETAQEYFGRPELALIPVVLSAASLGGALLNGLPTGTADLAQRIGAIKAAEAQEEYRRPAIATTVENAIDQGRALLLVDGLDEATPAEQRAAIGALGLVGVNRAILASRPATYSEGALVGWEVCETQRLDDAERRRLIDQVFASLYDAADPPDAQTLIGQLNERADLLVWSGNPLLLTLIATQYARGRQLPANRARIYEFAVEDMQRQRSLTARRLLTQREFEDRLRQLALGMFEARETVVTNERMLALLQTADPSTTAAIVTELRDRSGVFLEQTRGWGFVHLTFQEYLVACAVAEQTQQQRDAFCLRRSLSTRWEQVFLLVVSRLDLLGRYAESNRIIARLITADRHRVPALGRRDPTHLALRRATRCQIDRLLAPGSRAPIRWLKQAWWPIWRQLMRAAQYEGQVANLASGADIPAFARELSLAVETDPIVRAVSIAPENSIIPALIVTVLPGIAILVGFVATVIPTLAHSGFGRWWTAHLPVVVMTAVLLFVALRLVLARIYLSTLKLHTLFMGIAPFYLSWRMGDRKQLEMLWFFLINGKSLSHRIFDLADLRSMLADRDGDVQQAAVQAIAALGPAASEALPVLLPMLADDDRYVRKATVQAIRAFGPAASETLPALHPLFLLDSDSQVRQEAIEAIEAIAALSPAALRPPTSDELSVQFRLSWGDLFEDLFGRAAIKDTRALDPAYSGALPALLPLLHDSDPKVRKGAVRMFAAFDPATLRPAASEALPTLLPMLHDSDWHAREAAAQAIGALGPAASEALPELRPMLADSEWYVQKATIQAIGALGPTAREALPALLGLLAGSDSRVREAAVQAIAALGSAASEALPALLPMLHDSEWYVQKATIQAIVALGPAAREALPALLCLLAGSDSRVREAAVQAIGTFADMLPL